MVDLTNVSGNPLEQFVLLAKNARGAAAVELIKQALEAPGVFVFGELLDMPNIQDLMNTPHGPYLTLLNIFAFGTFKNLSESVEPLPEVSEAMSRKLRLLTVVSLAETSKVLAYSLLMTELGLSTVRELEDLVIEGISAGVVQGKLDQKSSHFEVDYVIGRDIRKTDIGSIVSVLSAWCDNCDNMLRGIEGQVDKVNGERREHLTHKASLDTKMNELKQQLKNQPLGDDGDPDSRMESEIRDRGERKKMTTKGKGIRGSSKSGGSTSFWKQ